MKHLLLAAAILATGLGLAPAHAFDQAKAGRYGRVDADRIEVGGAVSLPTIGPVDMTYAGIYNPNAVIAAAGNRVSFCPALSCIRGPGGDASVPAFFDHQRASLLVSAQTQLDNQAEEQTLAVTTTIGTGYKRDYKASTAYAVGDNVQIGNAMYRAVQAGTSGASSPPPGGRPSSVPFLFNDGTVRWQWINDQLIASKVGSYFETKVTDGAGAAWGAAFNYHIQTQPKAGMFLPGVEIDYINDNADCLLGVTDCTALRLAIGGSGQITTGMQITSDNEAGAKQAALWALRLNGDHLASQSAIEVDTIAPVGLGFGHSGIGTSRHSVAAIRDKSEGARSLLLEGNKSIAAIEDVSIGPTGFAVNGIKSIAAIRDASTAPTGILLQGTYTAAQISGAGWSVDPSGALTAARLNSALATPASSSAACVPGDWAHDASFVYTCVAANTWKRAALSSW